MIGIKDELEPCEPIVGNAYDFEDLPRLAADWAAATDMFESNPMIARIFDPMLIGNLVRCKRQEIEKFKQMPTSAHWRALLERV
jgi:glutamine synthetase